MRKSVVGLLAVVSLLMGVSGSMFAAGDLVMNGSTTVLPFAQSSSEAFMKQNPDVRISVSGGGSGNGAKGLIDGMVQIAMMSREMKDAEIANAKGKSVNPVKHVVAIDCIVPLVHPSNPVKDLKADQIRDIYSGKVTNWKEVGGLDKPIAVIGRDTSSGTYEVWEEKIMKKTPVTPRAQVVASSGALVQAVASNPLAIGYDGIGYVDAKRVKALKINGVTGNADTARSGKFTTGRFLFMYTNGEAKGDVKKYLDFLKSPSGQKYVAKEGFVTLK